VFYNPENQTCKIQNFRLKMSKVAQNNHLMQNASFIEKKLLGVFGYLNILTILVIGFIALKFTTRGSLQNIEIIAQDTHREGIGSC